jgi:threonine/homoserine/homoserine lactone efflux protein
VGRPVGIADGPHALGPLVRPARCAVDHHPRSRHRAGAAQRDHHGPHPRLRDRSIWNTFGRGLLTNLLNPKIGAFYVAVLPQFIPAGTSPLGVGLLLALVHDLEGLIWFTAIITGAQAFRGFLGRRRVQRTVDGGTGAVLVASA